MGDPNAPPLDSESLVGLLDRHGVAYVLVGGLAAVAYGAMRATFDVDIVPRWKADNLDALASALRAAEACLRVPTAQALFTTGRGGLEVDGDERLHGFGCGSRTVGGCDTRVRREVHQGRLPLEAWGSSTTGSRRWGTARWP